MNTDVKTDIDNELTTEQRNEAQALLDAELEDITPHHPLLPPLLKYASTPILDAELDRVSLKKPMTGVDLSRYEALEPPTRTNSISPESQDLWRNVLKASYISHEYLTSRTRCLHELDTKGKEEWLAGNEGLVLALKSLEEELAKTKEDIDHVVVERQRSQQSIEGELRLLEDGWKRGVSRTLETEVAADDLRLQILESMKVQV